MTVFYFFCAFLLLGLIIAIFLIFRDKEESEFAGSAIPLNTTTQMTATEISILNEDTHGPKRRGLFNRRRAQGSDTTIKPNNMPGAEVSEPRKNLPTDSYPDPKRDETAAFSENPHFGRRKNPSSQAPTTGTASLSPEGRESPDHQRSDDPEKAASHSLELEELRNRYNRLDDLFNEKSNALEKVEQALEQEKSHRKDFNKVKDLIEKELKDQKDQNRALKSEHEQLIKEKETLAQRLSVLEQKIGVVAPPEKPELTAASKKVIAETEKSSDDDDTRSTAGSTEDEKAQPERSMDPTDVDGAATDSTHNDFVMPPESAPTDTPPEPTTTKEQDHEISSGPESAEKPAEPAKQQRLEPPKITELPKASSEPTTFIPKTPSEQSRFLDLEYMTEEEKDEESDTPPMSLLKDPTASSDSPSRANDDTIDPPQQKTSFEKDEEEKTK